MLMHLILNKDMYLSSSVYGYIMKFLYLEFRIGEEEIQHDSELLCTVHESYTQFQAANPQDY